MSQLTDLLTQLGMLDIEGEVLDKVKEFEKYREDVYKELDSTVINSVSEGGFFTAKVQTIQGFTEILPTPDAYTLLPEQMSSEIVSAVKRGSTQLITLNDAATKKIYDRETKLIYELSDLMKQKQNGVVEVKDDKKNLLN